MFTSLSNNLYLNRKKSIEDDIYGSVSSIAFAPKKVRSYFGEYIDIAIASSKSDDIYFYNDRLQYQYVSRTKMP